MKLHLESHMVQQSSWWVGSKVPRIEQEWEASNTWNNPNDQIWMKYMKQFIFLFLGGGVSLIFGEY